VAGAENVLVRVHSECLTGDVFHSLLCDCGEQPNLELGFPADAREWGIGNQILADLGLSTIRILTNNPAKLSGLDGFGLTVVEQVPIEVEPQAENERYLAAKREKLGHTITKLHHQGVRFEPEPEPEEAE
jgi:3,4-dihydroxy 2-butanone 4-phosphate synthase/GTP cyclohydrolase II